MINYELWAIEVNDASEGPALMRRYDEHGEGSALTWRTGAEAQAAVDGMVEADSSYRHSLSLVRLTGASLAGAQPPRDRDPRTSPFETTQRFLRGPDAY